MLISILLTARWFGLLVESVSMAFHSRDELYYKVVKTFSEQPEIRKITIFGRNAEGTSDIYSDLDIRVHSNDPRRTQKYYLSLFKKISSVVGTFLIASDGDNLAQMIMLKDYSPYQKIDFGICLGEGVAFSPSVVVYENVRAIGNKQKMEPIKIVRDTEYNLDDVLFGVPRMTKCFFRRDFDMHRRWRGMINVTLVALFEKYFGYSKEMTKKELDAQESKGLFLMLKRTDKNMLEKILPLDGKIIVHLSYLHSLDFYLELATEKARRLGVALDLPFVNFMRRFAHSEIQKIQI